MKNAFLLPTFVIIAGYAVALVAEAVEIISFPLPSLPSTLGVYAVGGILAFAFRDYSRYSTIGARHAAAPAAPVEIRPAFPALSLTNSKLHAN